MKNSFLFVFIIFLLTFACSSDSSSDSDTDSNISDPIIPSNLVLDINIIGQTDSAPNGDGSGLITCSANASDAVNYEFRFGGGVTEQSTNGQVDYNFTEEGTNSYSVYVYAYSSTGHYTSTFQTFNLYVEGEGSTATWSEEFNYNGVVDSDTWTHEIGNGDWVGVMVNLSTTQVV